MNYNSTGNVWFLYVILQEFLFGTFCLSLYCEQEVLLSCCLCVRKKSFATSRRDTFLQVYHLQTGT